MRNQSTEREALDSFLSILVSHSNPRLMEKGDMRIAIAMSGGVDSNVAAFELKKKRKDIIGVTIKTWGPSDVPHKAVSCCSEKEASGARKSAEEIGISYYVVDLSEEFAIDVKKYLIDEYFRGRTPSPCIYCNSRIKFGYFLKEIEKLGAERIATGHYARIIKKKGNYYLAEALDKKYDQSYFLCGLSKEILSRVEFPIGLMTKSKVKGIAKKEKFSSFDRKPSQDICFAGSCGSYREYFKKIGLDAFTAGAILDISGKKIGMHKGIAAYTIGQRKGLGIASSKPLYVLKINPSDNTIVAGHRQNAMRKKIRVIKFNLLVSKKEFNKSEMDVRIRHNGEKVPALVQMSKTMDEAIVEFKTPQFAPAPGQAVVFYSREIVTAGAWIEEVKG